VDETYLVPAKTRKNQQWYTKQAKKGIAESCSFIQQGRQIHIYNSIVLKTNEKLDDGFIY
jgi:hypothetical protein